MRKFLLLLLIPFFISCTEDLVQEEELQGTYDVKLKINSFINVFEESARLNDEQIQIRITLEGNGNPYDNQYVIDLNSSLLLKGLKAQEYTLYANAFSGSTLFYKEITFNPAESQDLDLTLEGITTRFKVTPISWPAGCDKIEARVNFQAITSIDESTYMLSTLSTEGGQYRYYLNASEKDNPEFTYTLPFYSSSIEVILFDSEGNEMDIIEIPFEKDFEKLKGYNITIDIATAQNNPMGVSFNLQDMNFDDENVSL